MSQHKDDRKVRSEMDRAMNVAAVALDQGEFTQVVKGALRKAFEGQQHAVKQIARVANTNVRTARNWYEGHNAPDALHLLRLAAQIPELQAEVRRLLGMQADLDPEFERSLVEFYQHYTRLRDGRGDDR